MLQITAGKACSDALIGINVGYFEVSACLPCEIRNSLMVVI